MAGGNSSRMKKSIEKSRVGESSIRKSNDSYTLWSLRFQKVTTVTHFGHFLDVKRLKIEESFERELNFGCQHVENR